MEAFPHPPDGSGSYRHNGGGSPLHRFPRMEGSDEVVRANASGGGCTVGSDLAPGTCSADGSELGSTNLWID